MAELVLGGKKLKSLTIGDYTWESGGGGSEEIIKLIERPSTFTSLTPETMPITTVLSTIGQYAFYTCSSLTEASFPSCTSIGSSAFQRCTSLTTASFPACITIGEYAFYTCSSLTTASFPVCTSIGQYAFYTCSSLTTASFPACTSIGQYAFYTCSSLTTASFPVCTSIGGSAFRSCTSLRSVYFKASNMETISSNVFQSTNANLSIYVPTSLVDYYKGLPGWSYYASRITGFDDWTD